MRSSGRDTIAKAGSRLIGPGLARLDLCAYDDHYVTVFEVTDAEVIVGDPLNGLDKMTYDDFLKK